MSARELRLDFAAVAAVLLAGGCLNGLASQIIGASRQGFATAAAGAFGVSPMLALVIAISCLTLWNGRVRLPWLAPAACLYGLLMLWPSSLAAWGLVGAFATYVGVFARRDERTASVLLIGVSAASIWHVLVEPLAAGMVLPAEARMTAWLLSFIGQDAASLSNVVSTQAGHRIVILMACSIFSLLPTALLGWRALVLVSGAGGPESPWLTGGLLTLAVISAGLLRLVLMGWSQDSYAIAHGAAGKAIFDALVVSLVGIAALAARRDASPRRA